jgi:hypothetical protein
MTWRPLLEGADAAQARTAIDEIARRLAHDRSGGAFAQAERLLLYAYLNRAEMWPDEREARAERLIAAAGEESLAPDLHGGLAGVAFALAHVLDDAGVCEQADQALAGAWPARYDLLSGLVGVGVYALERRSALLLGRVQEQLARRARAAAPFWTEAHWLDPAIGHPRGHADLGLAHGLAGVVAFLGRCGPSALLDDTRGWLDARALAGDTFPRWVAPGETPVPTRAAWCYGDPGVAMALHAVDKERALRILRAVARRPEEDLGVVDAILCHGSAGLGHIFNRAHQASGDPALADAARTWLRRAIAERCPGDGCDRMVLDPARGTPMRARDPGLLTGAAGVALALLAAVTPIAPGWDRMLLLDV